MYIGDSFDAPIEEVSDVAKQMGIGLRLHVSFITLMMTSWAEHVEHLQCQLSDLNDKACFAKTDPGTNYGYKIDISDCQALQLLRRDILRTSTALGICLKIARGSRDHCRDTQLPEPNASKTACVSEIQYCIQQIQHQCLRINAMVVEVEATVGLLSKLLEYKGEQRLSESNKLMTSSLGALRQHSFDASKESALMLELVQQASKDAQTLNAFSTVATIYLPASLIATIFSSNLIHSDGSFRLTGYFWVFVVTSVCLALITFVLVALLRSPWMNKVRVNRWRLSGHALFTGFNLGP